MFLGTGADNMADRDAKGRQASRGRHGMAKLSEPDVSYIRKRYAAGGITQRALGNMYGVTNQQVSHIVRNVQWDGQASNGTVFRLT